MSLPFSGTTTKTRRKIVATADGKKPSVKPPVNQEDDQITAAAVLKMTENASYLIDKMFETSPLQKPVSKSSSKSSSKSRVSERFTEHAMYREAKQYDKSKSKDVTSISKSSSSKVSSNDKPSSPAQINPVSQTATSDLLQVEEDRVSEAGTYTIECDEEDNNEEVAAREKIDEVFGIKDGSQKANVISNGDLVITELETNGDFQLGDSTQLKKGETTLKNGESKHHKERQGKVDSSLEVEAGSDLQELRIIEDGVSVSVHPSSINF